MNEPLGVCDQRWKKSRKKLGKKSRKKSEKKSGEKVEKKSEKKHDLLAKGFLLPTWSTSILFICFSTDLLRVLATTKNTSAVAAYTRLYAKYTKI